MTGRLQLQLLLLVYNAIVVGQTLPSTSEQKPEASTGSPSQGQITVSPTYVRLKLGETRQFVAAVNGVANAAVRWAISGPNCAERSCGTISPEGIYTAPLSAPTPPAVKVTATSRTGLTATADVYVAEEVFKVDGDVTPPRPVYHPDPEYSREAREAKYEGTCVLWVIVGSDGRPRDIRVARILGKGLDEQAIKAVRTWKFKPAMKDGKPVAVQVNVEVTFRLYDGRADGSNPPAAPSRGVPLKTVQYTDEQLAQIRAFWNRKPSSSEEAERLRSQCAPYVENSIDDLETRRVPLPPHECATLLRWMRDLRVESFYASDRAAQ